MLQEPILQGFVGSNPTPAPHLNLPSSFEDFLAGFNKEVTAKTYLKRFKRLGDIPDLKGVQRIKTLICTYRSTESYKELLANATIVIPSVKG
jgi:hypothetical protein